MEGNSNKQAAAAASADKPDSPKAAAAPSAEASSFSGGGGGGPPTRPHHQPAVSWGEFPPPINSYGYNNNNQSPPRGLIYSGENHTMLGLSSTASGEYSPYSLDQPELGGSPNSNSNSRSNVNNNNNRAVLTVNDVLMTNPLESEAETLIIKALELQNNHRARADTMGSGASLLGNIPAEAIGVFSSPALTAEEEDGDESHHQHNNRPRLGTVDSRNSANTNTNNTNINNNINKTKKKKNHIPKPVNVQRNQTTEQSLASLAMAMEGFQDRRHQQRHSGGNNNNNNTTVQSAAEAFAQNANIVFRGGGGGNNNGQHQMKSERKISGTGAAAASVDGAGKPAAAVVKSAKHWGKLRNAVQASSALTLPTGVAFVDDVHHHKKTDNRLADEPPPDVRNSHNYYEDNNNNNNEDVECSVLVDDDVVEDDAANDLQDTNGGPTNDGPWKGKNSRKNHLKSTMMVPTGAVQDLQVFVGQRRRLFFTYVRFLLLVVIPATAVAIILFYFADNPPTGRAVSSANGTLVDGNGNALDTSKASSSWWILFICVRQALTFSLAQLLQVFIIDFLCLNTKFFKNMFGNLLTLLIAQSKGWPFMAVTWGLLDFALLHGSSPFASNWLYWQDRIDVFNEANPGGSVTDNIWNTRALSVAVSVGIVVSMKRLWLGLFLGKKTFANHAEDLKKVYQKAVLLCEVATLAREFQQNPFETGVTKSGRLMFGMSKEEFTVFLRRNTQIEEGSVAEGEAGNLHDSGYTGGLIIEPNDVDTRRGNLDQSQRMKLSELLGAWEEPEAEADAEENISISAILLFRNSLSILDNTYMFSLAWGDVSTRDRMVVNSQVVYRRLLMRSPDPNVLKFDVLAHVAEQQDGTLNQDKLRDLIRLLRPDRDGNLSLLEFVKSVDGVYKEAKLLRASVKNSGKIDRAFEKAINIFFYTIMVCIILSQIGIDPFALFLSLSSLILAFAFMIGSAASKMFEGWLFILVRRPYNIGDRIHISNPEQETDSSGSSSWIVKDVTLFHTTAVFASTNERATLSNGSLASSRVINMARSPNASISIYLKFSTSVPYEKIQVFDQALRDFIKARPREWGNFGGFRATQVLAEQGYVEYVVLLTHREAWQNVKAIGESKAEVSSFCLELSKKLEMRYLSPPLPVDLAFVKRGGSEGDNESVAAKLAGFALDDSSGMKELVALYDKKK